MTDWLADKGISEGNGIPVVRLAATTFASQSTKSATSTAPTTMVIRAVFDRSQPHGTRRRTIMKLPLLVTLVFFLAAAVLMVTASADEVCRRPASSPMKTSFAIVVRYTTRSRLRFFGNLRILQQAAEMKDAGAAAANQEPHWIHIAFCTS